MGIPDIHQDRVKIPIRTQRIDGFLCIISDQHAMFVHFQPFSQDLTVDGVIGNHDLQLLLPFGPSLVPDSLLWSGLSFLIFRTRTGDSSDVGPLSARCDNSRCSFDYETLALFPWEVLGDMEAEELLSEEAV